ncbi:MAG: Tetracycline resistance protein, class B [Chlamydiae bacterium]|nr:Tetracycline resistance protein, class B [Chlamydiota bacterium]
MRRIFPLLTVLFLGYLGFSLAIPLFPPLFLNPEVAFLPSDMSSEMRRILLGLLFAMYPIGQFIGAPLLGRWSDKYGRRPVILISLIVVIPAYLGSAFSLLYSLPVLLFVSRFFSGLLEGNIVIAQAAIADISEDSREKTKNFGWMVSLSSSAFFIGPLIGGKLADAKIVSWFHYDTPFWCAAGLSLIGFAVVALLFRETHDPDPEIELSFKTLSQTFIKGIKYRPLRAIFTANFFIFLSIFFFLNFFSAYLVNAYHFSISLLGEVNAYLAIPVILGPLLFGLFTKIWTTKKSIQIGSLLLGVSFIIFLLPHSPWALLFTLIPIGLFMAMGFAFPAIYVSDKASKRFQGVALGTNQSIQVFAEAFTALIGGFLMALYNSLPIYLAALCGLLGALALIKQKE